jgi:hypothetical protein
LLLVGCHSAASPLAADAPTGEVHTDGAVHDGMTMGSATDYNSDGPIAVTVTPETITANTHTIHATLYMPAVAMPPLVGLLAGSTQTAAGYAPYGQRLASYGIAALVIDDPGILTNTGQVVADDAVVLSTWATANLAVDHDHLGLAGHSRGGAASLLLAEHELAAHTVAWFGLDPVDNQFGQAPTQYARTDLAHLPIPSAFLGAEVASNCAPTADNYVTLYPLAPAPSTLILGKGAGHTELELAAGCTGCTLCTPAGTADQPTVLAYAVRYTTAFFARELLGDAHVGADFTGAGGAADITSGAVAISTK